MSASIQSYLAAGNYVGALQTALGQNASVKISNVDGKALATITGTPVGASSETASPTARKTAVSQAATVSLSPEAQSYLSKASIALSLIDTIVNEGKGASDTPRQAVNITPTSVAPAVATPVVQPVQPSAAAAPGNDVQSIDVQNLSPTDLVSSIISAAETAAADPNYFYNQVNSEPGALDSIVTLLGDTGASFKAAFDSKTLSITNTNQIPGLEQIGDSSFSGTSETFGATGVQEDLTYAEANLGQDGGSLISGLGIGGSAYITWPLLASST